MPTIKEYYDRPDVQFAIARQCYLREFTVIVPRHHEKHMVRRNLICHNTQHLSYHIRNLIQLDWDFNLYHSLAAYDKGVPRSDDPNRDKWRNDHYNHITSYDMLIDIDAQEETLMHARSSTEEITKYLDTINCPYSVRFSGGGFHIVIPWQVFKDAQFDPFKEENIYSRYKRVATYLYDVYSEMIDLSIYDSRRIIKIPYSIAMYKDRQYICYPLGPGELQSFSAQEYELKRFGKPVAYRGIPLQNTGQELIQEAFQ